jgi:hypothetical protein
MKYLPAVIGALTFALSRWIVVMAIGFSSGRMALADLPSQLLLGLAAGLIVSPFAFQLFSRKWMRIAVSGGGAAIVGPSFSFWLPGHSQIPPEYFWSSLALLASAWLICGLLAGWLGVEVLRALGRKFPNLRSN